MGWKLPTGYSDPENVWENEPLSFDGDILTRAYTPCITGVHWRYLVWIISPPYAPIPKFRISLSSTYAETVYVQYWDGFTWVQVYYGASWTGFKEFFTLVPYLLYQMRIVLRTSYCAFPRHYVDECQYWLEEAPPAVGMAFGDGLVTIQT